MPKSSRVEVCMICDEIPCSCFKKPAKSASEPKIRSAPTSAADSAPVSSPPTPDISPPTGQPAPDRDGSGRLVALPPTANSEMARALRVLSPILHPDEIVLHRIGRSPAEKAEQWRERNI